MNVTHQSYMHWVQKLKSFCMHEYHPVDKTFFQPSGSVVLFCIRVFEFGSRGGWVRIFPFARCDSSFATKLICFCLVQFPYTLANLFLLLFLRLPLWNLRLGHRKKTDLKVARSALKLGKSKYIKENSDSTACKLPMKLEIWTCFVTGWI